MGLIAGWKVDKISDLLTKSYDLKIQEIKDIMRDQLEKELIKYLSKDVLDFWSKYPDRVRMQGSISILKDGNWFSIYPKVPTLEMDVEKKILTEMSPIKKALLLYRAEIEEMELEKRKTKNQIRCTVSKLKTYKKLQENFPEAYKVLILDIDKEPEMPQSNLCDNVEELRAKLNNNNKKSKV